MDFQNLISSIFSMKILCLIIGSCLFLVLMKLRKQRKNPPGPKGLFGIIPLFKPFAFKYLYEVTKKYGPIVELSMFGKSIIIFGNHDVLKEAFIKNGDNFIDRPKSSILKDYSNYKGLIYSNGEIWKEQKKFSMSHLMRSGFQESYDKIILHEIELAFNVIDEKNGQSFDPKNLFIQMTTNIIMCMATSKRLDYNNTQKIIQTNMHEIIRYFRLTNPVHFFPPLKYILKSQKKFKESIQNIQDYLKNFVWEHENSFDENNIRDYVDAFLLKMYEEEKKGNRNTSFTREQLSQSLIDIFIAGSETSSNTLLFLILNLLHYPNIQTKIQKEIDDVIGTSRNPQMADCSKLPFTHATILETQRLSNVVPFATPRIVKENITIHGYDIPKGAFTLPNLFSMHYDPKYWNNPLEFDPERFLDKNKEIIKNIKSFLPFGTGHRQCMGEALAKSELFLIFTSLLQRYSLKSIEPKLPSMSEFVEGIVISPLPFEVCFLQK